MKTVFVLSLAVAALSVALALALFIEKPKTTSKNKRVALIGTPVVFPQNGITLNGIKCDGPKSDANNWINNFMDDNRSSENQTAIWFSKNWVDSIALFLSKEPEQSGGTGGIRIYFARKADGDNPVTGDNTVVIIAADDDMQDYFEHDDPDFSSFLNQILLHQGRYITEDHGAKDPGASFYHGANCNIAQNCIVTDGHNLSCTEAQAAVNTFNNTKRPQQAFNTESVFFPLELLQDLSQELDAPAPKGITPDGIRIYFAKNSVNHRHFFILVPTQADPNNAYSHIDNLDCFGGGGPRHPFGPTDDGEECPNNCNGVTLPSN
jgi:hypothetical protein